MDWIMIPLNFLIVFGTIYKLAELFVRKRERLMLISKLSEISNVDFRSALSDAYMSGANLKKGISLYGSGNKFTALRIGWLLLGVGFGFLAGFLINLMATYGQYGYNMYSDNMMQYHKHVAGIVYVACICICGGWGLLMSYRAERKAERPEEQKKDDEF